MKKEDKLKRYSPTSKEKYDAMYKRAFYIGKFMLDQLPERYGKFVSWIKKCRENNYPIRYVYNDHTYDFEIMDKTLNKWIMVGSSTSRILASSLII